MRARNQPADHHPAGRPSRSNGFDAALGGGRRDEEKARAKERFFSHRDDFGQWDPKNQRPELWNVFNGRGSMRASISASFRSPTLLRWTCGMYVQAGEASSCPASTMPTNAKSITRDGTYSGSVGVRAAAFEPDETVEKKLIRFRTMGDATMHRSGVESGADDHGPDHRGGCGRPADRARQPALTTSAAETAMEDRKKEGYF